MKSPRAEFGPAIRAQTLAGREKLADEILALETVRIAIAKRATEGFDSLVIRPPRPVDLHRTRAAKALVSHLQAEGFGAHWEAYAVITPEATQNGMELEISWKDSR